MFCDSCSAAGFTAADTVKQSHDPLNQGQISLTPITVKGPFNPGLSAEIDVEIAAGMPCCSTQKLWIEIIRPDLEWLDAVALGASPGQEGEGQQRLTATAGRCSDDNGHSGWSLVS